MCCLSAVTLGGSSALAFAVAPARSNLACVLAYPHCAQLFVLKAPFGDVSRVPPDVPVNLSCLFAKVEEEGVTLFPGALRPAKCFGEAR